MIFSDRKQAGELLYKRLAEELSGVLPGEMIVLSIPKGGCPVGSVVANRFGCDNDVLISKKIVSQAESELALGAVSLSVSSAVVNQRLVDSMGITSKMFKQMVKDVQAQVDADVCVYRAGRLSLNLEEKVVILVDDGVATGETMIAAVREVFLYHPHKVVVAVPVIAKDSLARLEQEADAVVFLQAPADFFAVGQWYRDFTQVSREDVLELINC